MENKVQKNQFETHEDYIQALKSTDVMRLSRRQLQDLAQHHMEKAKENEDWQKAQAAFRYQDLAINCAGSKAEVAKKAVSAILQVVPDEEESKKIDKIISEMQEENRRRGQNIADRMNAEKYDSHNKPSGEVTRDDIDIEKFKRQLNIPTRPDTEDTDFFVYQFAIGEGENKTQFDFRVMGIENKAYRQFEEDFSETEVPEDAKWTVNQFRGEPSIGTDNHFETLDDVEERIKDVIIAASTDQTLAEITDELEGENQ